MRLESHYIKRKKVYKKTNINFVVLLLKANISLYFDTNVCMSFCMSLSYTLCYVNINKLEMTCDVLMSGIINNFYILPVIKDEKSHIFFSENIQPKFFCNIFRILRVSINFTKLYIRPMRLSILTEMLVLFYEIVSLNVNIINCF